jgi:starch synthase
MKKILKVLYLSAEAAPLIKHGGLGDVAGSLPKALKEISRRATDIKDIDIRVVIPYYKLIDRTLYNIRHKVTFSVNHKQGSIPVEVFETSLHGLKYYLISEKTIASGDSIYSDDNAVDGFKFTLLSMAALELCRQLAWSPDILHANDWHTAPAVYSLSLIRNEDSYFQKTKSLLTIHNLPYLGEGAQSGLAGFGLPPVESASMPLWARELPLPQGLHSVDRINTVSKGYAAEIMTQSFGVGLHGLLHSRRTDISGILNGIDVEYWNPHSDDFIGTNFDNGNLRKRDHNKRTLQKELYFEPNKEIPLVGMVTRMVHQKGLDIAIETLKQLEHKPWQAIILGSGDHELEERALKFASDYPGKVRVVVRYDNPLSHRIYAGTDSILIPSRYEPCGLTQMIAMRYGCVPIASATGGLVDTIEDYNGSKKGTGFLFHPVDSQSMTDTLLRVFKIFSDKRRWRGIQRRGMGLDFSWNRSAREYINLYESMVNDK